MNALPSVDEAETARSQDRQVGSGAYRYVYRMPGSKWAYKFERGDEDDWRAGANKKEFENYNKHKDSLPDNIAFPEMHMLPNGVIATEFLEGSILARACVLASLVLESSLTAANNTLEKSRYDCEKGSHEAECQLCSPKWY